MLQERDYLEVMLIELNAFGLHFFLLPPLLHSILVRSTWDGGDAKQKSLFFESPLPPLQSGHSSKPNMIFFFSLNFTFS